MKLEQTERRGTSRGIVCRRNDFTLIELLIVIVIIAILSAILLPALNKARNKAQEIICISQQKQIGMAFMQYATSNGDFLPRATYVVSSTYMDATASPWDYVLLDYGCTSKIFRCPNDNAERLKLPSGNLPPQSYHANHTAESANKHFDLETSPMGKKIASFSGRKVLTTCVNAGPKYQGQNFRIYVALSSSATIDFNSLHYTPYTHGSVGAYLIAANAHSNGTTICLSDGSAQRENSARLINKWVTGVNGPMLDTAKRYYDITVK